MLKRNFLSWLTTSALMCALAGPAHAVVLSDTTFNDGDWSLGAAADTSTGLAPHPSRPVVVAGDPPTVQLYANELLATSAGGFAVLSGIGVQFDMSGNSVREQRINVGGVAPSYHAFHEYVAQSYSPGSGAISSVDFDYDHRYIDQDGPNVGRAVGWTPALKQNGIVYEYVNRQDLSGANDFANVSLTGLTAVDFVNWTQVGDGVNNPDFSGSGDEITFGYLVFADSALGAQYNTWGHYYVDDWQVTINAVPEPASLALVGLGGLLLLRRKR